MFRFYAFQQYLPHIIDTLIKSLHLPISCRFDNLCRKANHPASIVDHIDASIVDHGWFYRPKLWHEQPLIKVKRSCHHQIASAPILRPSLFIFADHSLPKYRRIDRRRLTRNGAITSKCPKITFSAEWNWLRSHEGVFFKKSTTWNMVHFDGKLLLGVFQRVFDIIWDICGARPALCFITGFCRVTSVFKLNIWFEQSHHCRCKSNLIFGQYAIFQFYLSLAIVGYIS